MSEQPSPARLTSTSQADGNRSRRLRCWLMHYGFELKERQNPLASAVTGRLILISEN
jgi:hypothetical protein